MMLAAMATAADETGSDGNIPARWKIAGEE